MPRENRVVNKSMLPKLRSYLSTPDTQRPGREEIFGFDDNIGKDGVVEYQFLMNLLREKQIPLPKGEEVELSHNLGFAIILSATPGAKISIIDALQGQGFTEDGII